MPVDLRRDGEVVTELGGRSVHLLVQAGEGPPIVLLGGCAVPSYAFADVLDLLPGRWVVVLDRPGLVATRWPGTLPTLAQEVATLTALCALLGEPAVVAGHSMAGPHAEALVRAAPASTRGLVLVDASVELEPRRPRSGTPWLLTSRAVRRATGLPLLARLGSLGERTLVSAQSVRRRLTDAQPEVFRDLFRRPDTLAMVVAEQAAYAGQLWDLAQQRRETAWPGTPTVLLTAAATGGPSWITVQRELAELLGGRHVVIEDSRHLVMIDRPDLLADAVLSLAGPVPPGPDPVG